MQLNAKQMMAFRTALDGLMNPEVAKGGNPEFAFMLIVGPLDGHSMAQTTSNITLESEHALVCGVKEQLEKEISEVLNREENPH